MHTFYSNLTGTITVSDRDFIGKGGQATVYLYRSYALKVYHDAKSMVPEDKLRELAGLKPANILKPLDVLYNGSRRPVGYVMQYCRQAEPLCRLFARSFKQQHSLEPSHIARLADRIRKTVQEIHQQGFLVVDLNEFNVLVSDKWRQPMFIDVDSYQTPRHGASAVMESICDPLAQNSTFTTDTDWYAYGIVSFQLFIGIHPFKGRHPDYRKGEWQERMRVGASVLDDGARLPAACGDLGSIPRNLLDWYRLLFSNQERGAPPVSGHVVPLRFDRPLIQTQTAGFNVSEVCSLPESIRDVCFNCGTFYLMTDNGIWRGNQRVGDRQLEQESLLPNLPTPLVVGLDQSGLLIRSLDGVELQQEPAERMLVVGDALCSVYQDALYAHRLNVVGDKTFVTKTKLCPLIGTQTRVFDGMLLQESLDHSILIYPYANDRCIVKPIPELDGYRVINARGSSNVVAFLAQTEGQVDRILLVFAEDYQSYRARINRNVDDHNLNFAVLPNGVCVLSASDDEVQVSKDTQTVNTMQDPPFTPGDRLHACSSGLHFVAGNQLHRVSTRR